VLQVGNRLGNRRLRHVEGASRFDVNFFYGVAGPAKMQPAVVERIEEAIREITGLADVRARMTALGMSVDFRSSDQFRELISGEYKKYAVVVRDAGIQPN
jgi:tripartite-type tricarboxylate transporter receptor subunit TctC